MISKKAVYSKDLFMTSLFCIDDYFLSIEGSMTSAGNLEWFIDSLLNKEDGKRLDNAYAICDWIVESMGPSDSSIIFLPFLYGTNVNADARAAFIGIDGSQNREHMVRALFEGVVFSHLMHIERLLKFMDTPQIVRISGGATESKIWVQIFADVLQMPIEVSAAKELGTLGAAMCVAVAVGDYPNLKTAADKMQRIAYTCQPNTQNKDIYRKKYGIYQALIEGIDPVWKRWREL
jgi:L-xylulokinase